MEYPEPVEEGAVKISWIPSTIKPDRVKAILEIDFGKTDMSPTQAGAVQRSLIDILRLALGIRLSIFK